MCWQVWCTAVALVGSLTTRPMGMSPMAGSMAPTVWGGMQAVTMALVLALALELALLASLTTKRMAMNPMARSTAPMAWGETLAFVMAPTARGGMLAFIMALALVCNHCIAAMHEQHATPQHLQLPLCRSSHL